MQLCAFGKGKQMETIKLNNGVEMPMIGFGTYQVTDPKECVQSVAAAIRNGYRLIDAAQLYKNEDMVGEGIALGLAQTGLKREDIFVTSKVWFSFFENDGCRRVVEESLKKLKLGYLDLVLLHWPFGNYYHAWRELEKMYKEGMIRAIGISNFEPARMVDLISYNEVVPAVNQVEAHLYCQRKIDTEWMRKYQIQPQAFAPLGQGRAKEMFSEPAVVAAAQAHGKTPAQIALRFLVQSGIAAVPKSVHENRIIENHSIFDFELTKEEMEALAALDKAAPMIGLPSSPEKAEFLINRPW